MFCKKVPICVFQLLHWFVQSWMLISTLTRSLHKHGQLLRCLIGIKTGEMLRKGYIEIHLAFPPGGSSLSSTSQSSLVAWHQQQPTPTSTPWQNALTRQLTNSWIWRPEQQSNFIIHCLRNIFFFYLDTSTSHSRWRLIRSTWSEWLALYSSRGSSPLLQVNYSLG